MIDLEGKRALVTGGARGIGAAIAVALAENGADVAFTYQQSTEKAEAVAKFIADKGRRAIAIQADSANPQAIECAVAQAISTLGGLDILVNSAAIGLNGMIADIDVDDYQALMDINVRGPVLFAKAVIPHLPRWRKNHHNWLGTGRAGALCGCNSLCNVQVGVARIHPGFVT